MLGDQQLLRRYAADGSEAAFGELVARYVNLVYSVALRRTNGDTHLAQDVAQLVFTDLARKARSLPEGVVLAGWLHRATRYAAAQLLRTERRRVEREQEAVAMNTLESETAPDWEQIRPLLDQALDELGRDDRDALLLRFFEQRSLAEVGTALGSNEDAARKRVTRALEKLRTRLTRRGVTTSAVALSGVLPVHSIQAAPAGLAATLASASLASAAAGTGTTLTVLKLMTMTKLKAAIVSAIVVASVVTPLVIQHQAQAKLREATGALRHQVDQLAQLQAEHDRLYQLAAMLASSSVNTQDELQGMRDKVAALRPRTNDLAALQKERWQLQYALNEARQESQDTNVQASAWSDAAKAKANYSGQLAQALWDYAAKHQDQFPTNFDDAAAFVSALTGKDSNFTPDQFEILYKGTGGALANYANRALILLIREKQPWKNTDGKLVKIYATGVGVEIISLADGNFEAWEKQHIISPESSKP